MVKRFLGYVMQDIHVPMYSLIIQLYISFLFSYRVIGKMVQNVYNWIPESRLCKEHCVKIY